VASHAHPHAADDHPAILFNVVIGIILALTLAVLRSSGRWVYYGGAR
jgi:hypothetical protein